MGTPERRKDPEGVRAKLVDATAMMIAAQGLARVTVDAVAAAAGVTKGGLFHHFPSKQALIDGVVDAMIADADATIDALIAADPEPHGSFTRAMLRSVLSPAVRECQSTGVGAPRLVCVAMLADPTLTARWNAWYDARLERHRTTDGDPCCAVVQLATDGLWLSSLQAPGEEIAVDAAVLDQLLAMTRAGP